MSSCGNPSIDNDELMPRRLRFNRGRCCIKCKANPGKIVIRHAVYCKECFTPLVTLKFRRSLEPSINPHAGTSKRPKLKASGSLMLGFSGGLGSSVLLDIVRRTYFTNELSPDGEPRGGTNHPRSARVWPSCAVCYVEVCNAFPGARDRTKEIEAALVPYSKFDLIPLRLEYAFDDSWWEMVTKTRHSCSLLAIELGKDGLYTEALRLVSSHNLTPVNALRTYLESLPTQTAVSNAIKVLVRLLLLYTAQSRRASHLLLGTSLTMLSITLISCISQGGGHSIQEVSQEEWQSGLSTTEENLDPIRVVHPLRDVTMKECTMFAWWNSIQVVGRDKQIRATAGIPGLTKDFIVGLEKDYPSTVSTIVRTCVKLEPKYTSLGLCILCRRPVQGGLEDWKSRIAIRSYSDTKLSQGPAYPRAPAPLDSFEVSATADEHPSISVYLCYSCRTMFTSRGTRASRAKPSSIIPSSQSPSVSAPLPLWVSALYAEPHAQDNQSIVMNSAGLWVGKPQDPTDLRNKITDFLLDA